MTNFLGANVNVSYRFPDFGTIYSEIQPASVVISNTALEIANWSLGFDIDFYVEAGRSFIKVSDVQGSYWNPAAFNGVFISELGGTLPNIVSVQIASQSGTDIEASDISLSAPTGSSGIAINWANETFGSYAVLVLEVIFENAPISAVIDTDSTVNSLVTGALVGSTVGIDVSATDANPTDSVSYSLVSPTGEFAIDTQTGVITTASAIVDGGIRQITVRALSTDGTTSDAVFSVEVMSGDVEPTTDADASANRVVENAAVGTQVGITGRAVDRNSHDVVSYALVNPTGDFAVDAATGVVTVARAIDIADGATRSITILSTSTDGTTSQKDFVVTIVNDPFDDGVYRHAASTIFAAPGTLTGHYASVAGISGNSDFDSVVVWQQGTSIMRRLMHGDNVSYGADMVVNASASEGISAPIVLEWKGLSRGSHFVVWTDANSGGSNSQVKAIGYSGFGGTSNGEVVLATNGSEADADVTGAGHLLAVFRQGTDLYLTRYVVGSAPITPVRVHAHTDNMEFDPQIAVLANGGSYVVTWTRELPFSSGGLDIRARLYDAQTSTFGAEFTVHSVSAGNQHSSSVTALADGGFVVTWLATGAEPGLGLQRFNSSGVRVGSEGHVEISPYGGNVAPAVTGLSSGGFVLVWDDGLHIKAALFASDGNQAGPAFTVNPANQSTDGLPTVTELSGGRLLFAWDELDLTAYEQGYTPTDGVFGLDVKAVIYEIHENGLNHAPTAMPSVATTDKFTALRVAPLAGSVDPDGNALFLSAARIINGGGSVQILSDGTLLYTPTTPTIWVDGSPNQTTNGTYDPDTGETVVDGALPYQYLSSGETRTVTIEFTIDDGAGGTDTDILTISVTGVNRLVTQRGSSGVDVFSGTGGRNEYFGEAGDDTINGLGGDDRLHGGAGMDTIKGGAGNDVIYGDGPFGTEADDVLYGGDGDDTLYGGGGNDRLMGDGGADAMYGGAGDDRYTVDSLLDTVVEVVGGGRDTVYADVSGLSLSNFANVERLYLNEGGNWSASGGAGDDEIGGNSGDNLLEGHDGRDVIRGGAGNDELRGGAGNDVLTGGEGSDILVGGLGNDRFILGDYSDQIIELANEGVDLITTSVVDNLMLAAYANVENVTLEGSADLSVTGSATTNVLTGNDGANHLWGLAGADVLRGGNGDDHLDGGMHADRLYGGQGDDVLTGGHGADRFYFSWGEGRDIITDFNVAGTEQIIFNRESFGIWDGSVSDYLSFGEAPDNWHGYFIVSSTGVAWDADGAGGMDAVEVVAFLSPVTGLGISEFALI